MTMQTWRKTWFDSSNCPQLFVVQTQYQPSCVAEYVPPMPTGRPLKYHVYALGGLGEGVAVKVADKPLQILA